MATQGVRGHLGIFLLLQIMMWEIPSVAAAGLTVELIPGVVAAAFAVIMIVVIGCIFCQFGQYICPVVRASGDVSAPTHPHIARFIARSSRNAVISNRSIVVGKTVKMKNFSDHLQLLHRDSDLRLLEEFEKLQNSSPRFSQKVAMREENHAKNRFVHILPYDGNRVQLSRGSGASTSDYINASYIQVDRGYTSPKEYIATQSPLPATVPDFWRMVWEHKSSLIVMIGNAKPTVDMHWPEELRVPVQYGDTGIVVEMTSKSAHLHHTARTFHLYLKNGGEETLQVTHYFLPDWDGASTQDWLDCIATVSQETGHQQSPTIVHCNDGVGNTGVFIALDFLMQFVRNHSLEDKVNIYNLVLNMRLKRPFMVQTERQYVFIHDALKVLIDSKMERMQRGDNAYTNLTFGTEENRYSTLSPYEIIPDQTP